MLAEKHVEEANMRMEGTPLGIGRMETLASYHRLQIQQWWELTRNTWRKRAHNINTRQTSFNTHVQVKGTGCDHFASDNERWSEKPEFLRAGCSTRNLESTKRLRNAPPDAHIVLIIQGRDGCLR